MAFIQIDNGYILGYFLLNTRNPHELDNNLLESIIPHKYTHAPNTMADE
jgi:GTP-sensing pleiotropic transcriptional regulator CodY